MEIKANEILENLDDYKVCSKCKVINSNKNKQCCNSECCSEIFDLNNDAVKKAVEDVLDNYTEIYGSVIRNDIMFMV